MNHISFFPTPLTKVTGNAIFGIDGELIIKRDDLFYECGGGSKARMLQYILTPDTIGDAEIIVTAGGPLSNFNRACALHCASLGIKLHLICYTEQQEEFKYSLNYFLVKLSNVKITICDKKDVPTTIKQVLESYRRNNVKAMNIYGGGRCLEGIYAYYDAVKELSKQLSGSQFPDKIFVACGTGTTTSGISMGCQDFFPDTEVHAISVARKKDAELPIIMENINIMNRYMNTSRFNGDNIVFHDEYLLNGYGKTCDELNCTISQVLSKAGIMLDPVYSGKAFYGMTQVLNKTVSEKPLFWHTGAVYTLLSERHMIKI